MYHKRRKKICPFCQGRLAKDQGDYTCQNCGIILSRDEIDGKTFKIAFLGEQK
jgi:transcription initiation factor TFIIIB Brf1 subunit/transcription initiation factor TFIIB